MLTEEQFSYLAKKYMDTVFRLALHYTKKPLGIGRHHAGGAD